jgi:hypothetical protein
MPTTAEPPADLLEAASALDAERFERFVNELLRVRADRTAGSLRADEAALLARINVGLPADVWAEYHRLRERCRDQTLRPAEHADLIRLTDAVEEYQAARAAALADLAALRGQSLPELAATLGITGPATEPLV